jgi:HD-like signal output (HDOD) protein/nitrogen-specific signal transduction histidine kinase
MDPSDSNSDPDVRSRLTTARLPVLPQLLVKLTDCCRSDELSIPEIAELIAKDAAMTAKVFAQAGGSTRHHAPQPVDLEQALIALGNDMVKTLLISESVLQAFNDSPQSNGVELLGFWKRSLSAALAARMIAARIGYPHTEEAYFAGLLHDIGRLVLPAAGSGEHVPNSFAKDDEARRAAEQRMLSITHAEAGARLIERWKLDSFLSDSVLYQDQPVARLEKAHPLIRIVFVAHQLSRDIRDNRSLTAAGSPCGIKAADLAQIRSDAAEQVRKAALSLGIDLAGTDEPQGVPPQATLPSARTLLAEKMGDLVLASEARRSFANQRGEADLLEMATRSARILFDFEDAIILLLDHRSHALKGTAARQHGRRGAELSIPLDCADVIAEAVSERRPTYIWRDENPLGIAEEQLLRMLGTDFLVCLPLATADSCHGVMIGAASSSQLSDLQLREGSLQAFGAEAAAAYKKILIERSEIGRERASVREQYADAARKAAHEVNNPLSIIKNYLYVLDRKLAKQESVSAEMTILNEEIDRVSRIVDGLANLQPASQEGATEINRIVADVVRLFQETEYAPSSVRIVARMPDQPFGIDSDADTLKQILVNLVKNAIEALPGGGEITIGSNGLVNRDGVLYVTLWVSDTGPGISAEMMASLFSPVHSTKGEGHRGLGLSIVHTLVKKIHGTITCRTDNNGATFEILLPGRIDHTRALRHSARTTAKSL